MHPLLTICSWICLQLLWAVITVSDPGKQRPRLQMAALFSVIIYLVYAMFGSWLDVLVTLLLLDLYESVNIDAHIDMSLPGDPDLAFQEHRVTRWLNWTFLGCIILMNACFLYPKLNALCTDFLKSTLAA